MKFDNYEVRQLSEKDTLPYFQLIENNRKRLEDFFATTVSKTKNLEATVIFISEILEKIENKTYFPFIVIDTDIQEIIGFIDIKNITWNIPKAELGCFIDEKYAGKGVSSKAMLAITDHFFNQLGFVKLFLRTHQDNKSGRRLAEKCGFIIEGTLRKDHKTTKGEIVDLLYYGKLRDDQ